MREALFCNFFPFVHYFETEENIYTTIIEILEITFDSRQREFIFPPNHYFFEIVPRIRAQITQSINNKLEKERHFQDYRNLYPSSYSVLVRQSEQIRENFLNTTFVQYTQELYNRINQLESLLNSKLEDINLKIIQSRYEEINGITEDINNLADEQQASYENFLRRISLFRPSPIEQEEQNLIFSFFYSKKYRARQISLVKNKHKNEGFKVFQNMVLEKKYYSNPFLGKIYVGPYILPREGIEEYIDRINRNIEQLSFQQEQGQQGQSSSYEDPISLAIETTPPPSNFSLVEVEINNRTVKLILESSTFVEYLSFFSNSSEKTFQNQSFFRTKSQLVFSIEDFDFLELRVLKKIDCNVSLNTGRILEEGNSLINQDFKTLTISSFKTGSFRLELDLSLSEERLSFNSIKTLLPSNRSLIEINLMHEYLGIFSISYSDDLTYSDDISPLSLPPYISLLI